MGNPHNLTEYFRRMQLLEAAANTPARQRPATALIEPANPVTKKDATQQQEAAVQTIFATGRQQDAQPVVVPQAAAFQAVRNGRIWTVYFGDTAVAVGPAKRRARAMARTGNDFLRHQQNQAVVDPTAFVAQMQTFFQLASDPTTGFQPQLNTVWPTD